MILSDGEILVALDNGLIKIDPRPSLAELKSSAINLRISAPIVKKKLGLKGVETIIDPLEADSHEAIREYSEEIQPDNKGYVLLEPGDFILARTLEVVELPLSSKIAARIEGRSTLARYGIAVHQTAPTVHCGWNGPLVLEISHCGWLPVKLKIDELPIAQLIFERVGEVPQEGLRTKHLGQEGPN